VRYSHFGEGEYDTTEKAIQQLLQEAGAMGAAGRGIEKEATVAHAGSPETYLGYGRIERFASPESLVRDAFSTYSIPQTLATNDMAYGGSWKVGSEYAQPAKSAALEFRFDSKEVYLVMRPGKGVPRVRVLVDGKVQAAGADVVDGVVSVDADRLYRLVKLDTAGVHTLRLEFLDDNTQVFAFTFG
jgi:hypothetical protein